MLMKVAYQGWHVFTRRMEGERVTALKMERLHRQGHHDDRYSHTFFYLNRVLYLCFHFLKTHDPEGDQL